MQSQAERGRPMPDPGTTTAVEPVNSKLVRTTKESVPTTTITPVARHDSTDLQYIQKYIIKEGSPSLLLWIPTKDFCLATTTAVMRHIEDTRNATFLDRSVQFKYQICEGGIIVDYTTVRNLEFTVNLSTRNDKETVFGVLDEMLTLMEGSLLQFYILQPLADERTINTQLDCVQELTQSEETFLALRTSLKAFNDVDHLIISFIQVPTKPSVKHSEQGVNRIINLEHTLKSIVHAAQAVATCENRLLRIVHCLLTDQRLE
ncbi:MAG: muts domain III-domain-containing protein [Benniella sp.]|nr:MAG: muts domain III-domain-containing protein [Benniella sp.]